MTADLVTLSRSLEERLGVAPLIKLNGKVPPGLEWTVGPWADPDGWRSRLAAHDGNVGMLTGCSPDRTGVGYLALDLDLYKPTGQDCYEIATDLGWIVDTVAATTGRGGLHLLLSYDPARWVVWSRSMKGKPIPGMSDVFPDGFEVKAERGQIVVEPSVNPTTGTSYQWIDGQSPFEIDVAPAPESLLELVGIKLDPESGEIVGGGFTEGWRRYMPEQVDPATAEAVTILCEHFGGHDPIIVRTGAEPSVEIVRPGKDATDGRSATVGWLKPGLVKVFTDGWEPFDQGQVVDLPELRRLAGIEVRPTVTVPTLTLPDGYRLWRPEDDNLPAPTLGAAAYHGPIGDYLSLLEGQTEAHPAAIGAHLLAGIATMIGRVPIYAAGSITHRANLFLAVVGPTSTGGKGVAEADANRLLRTIDPGFHRRHTLAGLGSGEMLVYEVRDPNPDDDKDRGGVKERIIQNAELSGTFKVCAREGSILGDHLRLAFDGAPLRHATRTHGIAAATDHHVSIVGSITPPELLKLLDDVARANGFGNRFLFLWSEIGALLPFGGNVSDTEVARIADVVAQAVHDLHDRASRATGHVIYTVADPAREAWEHFYRRARLGLGAGFASDLTARAVAHGSRIALVYAVLDGVHAIGPEHIAAAEAWVDYGHRTVEKVFGGGVSGLAGMLLTALRDAGPDGLTLTEQSEVFGRNRTADELAAARADLEDAHLITTCRMPGPHGRRVHRSMAIWPTRVRKFVDSYTPRDGIERG